jgi:hypothetical protein
MYFVYDADGRVKELYEDESDARARLEGGEGLSVRVIEPISTCTLTDIYENCCVVLLTDTEGRELWLKTCSAWEGALVEGYYRYGILPHSVLIYDSLDGPQMESVDISPLSVNILKTADGVNNDLCALAIMDANGCESEEELRGLELRCNDYLGKAVYENGIFASADRLTLNDLKRAFAVWNSISLDGPVAECFGAFDLFLRVRRHATDLEEFWFFSFYFSLLERFENRFPYELYKRIVAGDFKKYYHHIRRVRSLL